MEDNNIKIRVAVPADIDCLLEFIKENWNENHVFVREPDLFKYYHLMDNNKVSFVLAEDTSTKKIYGILGCLMSNSTDSPDIWTVIWKTVKSPNTMLGVDLLNFIKEASNCRILSSCGINKKTEAIYKFLGYSTGKLGQYYRIADKNEYSIALIQVKEILPAGPKVHELVSFETMEELQSVFDFEKYRDRKPYKDNWYIDHRYFNHPVYKYKVYGIKKKDETIDSILVSREIEQNGVKILRIVDFIGKDADLEGISHEMQTLIDTNSYEYIDFYCHGIDHEIMEKAGFTLRKDKDVNIIPNYFGPFEQKNIDLYFFSNDDENFYMFKADGDQDRPNFV